MELSSSELGRRIRAARRASGLAMDALARELEVSPSTVFRWERGVMMPGLRLWSRLCDVLGPTLSAA